MKIDKYRDMALRNPIGCTWWKWLSSGADMDDQPGWQACARRLRNAGVLKYYGMSYDSDLGMYLKLTKELLPVMVWDIGMDSWWRLEGVPQEVAQGDIRGVNMEVLRTDVINLRGTWKSMYGDCCRYSSSNSSGMLGAIPVECSVLDEFLESVRPKLKIR